jgi:hypothetical protein
MQMSRIVLSVGTPTGAGSGRRVTAADALAISLISCTTRYTQPAALSHEAT